MKAIIVGAVAFASLVAGSHAQADTVRCSDAAGELTYTSFTYSGGAKPLPGIVAFEEKYMFRGDVVGHTRTCFTGPQPVDPTMDNCASFVGVPFAAEWSTKTVLAHTATNFISEEVFAAYVSVVGIPAITHGAYLICESTRYHLVP